MHVYIEYSLRLLYVCFTYTLPGRVNWVLGPILCWQRLRSTPLRCDANLAQLPAIAMYAYYSEVNSAIADKLSVFSKFKFEKTEFAIRVGTLYDQWRI